jgi:purine nucleoside permease
MITPAAEEQGRQAGLTVTTVAAAVAAGLTALVATTGVVSLLRVQVFRRASDFCREVACTAESATDTPVRETWAALDSAGIGGQITATVTYIPWIVMLAAACSVLLALSLSLLSDRRSGQ